MSFIAFLILPLTIIAISLIVFSDKPPSQLLFPLFDKSSKKSCIILVYKGDLTEKELRNRLLKLLPEYMIPNKWHQVEAMPLNLNGKVDRQKLKELYLSK